MAEQEEAPGKIVIKPDAGESGEGSEAEDGEDEGLWPMVSLRARLAAHVASPSSSSTAPAPKGVVTTLTRVLSGGIRARGAAVLLTTGAMNPAHVGHAELMRTAARRVEQAGFDVLAAFLSPTHDGYVQPKARSRGTVGLSGPFRAELVRRTADSTGADTTASAADAGAVAGSGGVAGGGGGGGGGQGGGGVLVELASWEVSQRVFVDFPDVCLALKRQLEDKGINAKVFYVCGTDHALRCHLTSGMRGDLGLVVVPRAGERPPAERPGGKAPVLVAATTPGEVASFSSTKVREAVARGDEDYVRRAMAPGASELLLNPTDEEKLRFASDFRLLKRGGS